MLFDILLVFFSGILIYAAYYYHQHKDEAYRVDTGFISGVTKNKDGSYKISCGISTSYFDVKSPKEILNQEELGIMWEFYCSEKNIWTKEAIAKKVEAQKFIFDCKGKKNNEVRLPDGIYEILSSHTELRKRLASYKCKYGGLENTPKLIWDIIKSEEEESS
jgi:hypothetical protein